MTELSTDVATGDPGHADMHNEERAAINALSAISAISRFAIDGSTVVSSATWTPAGLVNDIAGESGVTISGGTTLDFAEGLYAVRVRVEFNSSTSGTRDVRLGPWDDLGQPFAAIKMPTEPGSSRQIIERTYIVPLATALSLSVECWQNTGSGLAVQGYVWVARIAIGGGSVGGGGGGGASTAADVSVTDGFNGYTYGGDAQTVFDNIDQAFWTVAGQLDGKVSGPQRFFSADTVALTNVTLSGDATINGVTFDWGKTVLVVGQTDPNENGIYAYQGAGTPWLDVSPGASAIIAVEKGDYAGRIYVFSGSPRAFDLVDSGPVDTEAVQDIIGAMVSGNTETGIAVTYDDATGKLNFVVSGGSSGGIRSRTRKARTTDFTINASSWTDVDNTTFDTTIAAAAGDVIELALHGYWGSAANYAHLDIATIVSSAPVNYVSGHAGNNSSAGILGAAALSGAERMFSAMVSYVVQAGDISGGNVTFRLRARSTGSRTLSGSANWPAVMEVLNLGTPVG